MTIVSATVRSASWRTIGMATLGSCLRAAPLSRRCSRITGTTPLLGGSGTIRLLSKLLPPVPSITGPPATASNSIPRLLGGEASQWEPQLVRKMAYVEHPRTSGGHNYYHRAKILPTTRSTGCVGTKHLIQTSHSSCIGRPGPLMVRITYRKNGRISIRASSMMAGEKYRERAFQRARQMGWIPSDAQLTPGQPPWLPGS